MPFFFMLKPKKTCFSSQQSEPPQWWSSCFRLPRVRLVVAGDPRVPKREERSRRSPDPRRSRWFHGARPVKVEDYKVLSWFIYPWKLYRNGRNDPKWIFNVALESHHHEFTVNHDKSCIEMGHGFHSYVSSEGSPHKPWLCRIGVPSITPQAGSWTSRAQASPLPRVKATGSRGGLKVVIFHGTPINHQRLCVYIYIP